MNQTITVSPKTIDEIFSRLDELTKTVKKISIKLLSEGSRYGSDEWWRKEELEADDDIKKGRLFGPFKNANELLESLHRETNQ